VLIDPEPLLPTRGYRILFHDATLIDLEAESMWPVGTQLEWTITTLVSACRVRWWCSGAGEPTSTSCSETTGRCGRR
jgi:hypothetical protein